MKVTVTVSTTVGSPIAPYDGADPHDVTDTGSVRQTGYPLASGCVPDTLTGDGQPVGVVLLTEEPVPPGQPVEARPVALIHALADGQPNTLVFCVPVHDANFAMLTGPDDLRAWHADRESLDTLLHRLHHNQHWQVTGYDGAAEAELLLGEARHSYERLTGCLE
ncbi:inorganic diphosphatase [Streptomyces sp. NPDC004690]